MGPITKIVLASIVTFATLPLHADLFISRKALEPDYLVQHCVTTPQIICSSSAHLSPRELKRVQRKIHWMWVRTMAAYHLMTPIYMRQPGFLFQDIPTYRTTRDGLYALLHTKEGGVVHVPSEAPGARFIDEIVDAATAPDVIKMPVPIANVPTS